MQLKPCSIIEMPLATESRSNQNFTIWQIISSGDPARSRLADWQNTRLINFIRHRKVIKLATRQHRDEKHAVCLEATQKYLFLHILIQPDEKITTCRVTWHLAAENVHNTYMGFQNEPCPIMFCYWQCVNYQKHTGPQCSASPNIQTPSRDERNIKHKTNISIRHGCLVKPRFSFLDNFTLSFIAFN